MDTRIDEGLLQCMGTVREVTESKLPNVFVVSVDCGKIALRFDVFKDLLMVKEGDDVSVVLSRERPEFNEGEDLVLWGYIMSKKRSFEGGKTINKLLVSLWGYLLIAESEEDLLSPFSIMDRVYFKLAKIAKPNT